MSRLFMAAAAALLMAVSPALSEEKPASGEGTTPAAKEQNSTAPNAVENADPGRTGAGGGGAGGAGAGAGAGGAGGAGAGGAGGAGGGAGGAGGGGGGG